MFEAGVCGCHGYDLTQGDDYLKIFETMVFMKELMPDSDEDTKRKLVATLCSSLTNDGDQLQVCVRRSRPMRQSALVGVEVSRSCRLGSWRRYNARRHFQHDVHP